MNGSQIVVKETHGTDRNIDIQEDFTLEDPARDGYTFLGWVHTIDTSNYKRHTFTARWAQNVNLGEVAYDALTAKSAQLNTQDSSGSYTSISKTYSYFTVGKDGSYFTVTPKGNLAAGKTYTETIYLTKKDDNSFVAAYQVSVAVTPATATPSFAENGRYAVTVGESKETKLDNLPTDATVAYASNDNAIVRVSENGTITGVSAGTATITATITAENYTEMIATCTVTVSPQQFTIVIDPQNGDEAVTRDEKVSAGEKVAEPAGGPYTKDGCEFLGWSLNKDATTEEEVWNFDNPVTAEADWDEDGIITFYAVYAPVYYTVTFNLDGGQWNGAETQQVQKDAQIQKPVDPTKEGYTFQGWAYNSEGHTWMFDNSAWKVQGDLTLTAKWEPIGCTVTFDANGGAFTDLATTHVRNDVDYGTALDPVSDKPEQDGYTFLGWSTNANATEADWVFDTGVSSTVTPTPVTEENLTLYAVWQIQDRTIVYQNENGEKATVVLPYNTEFKVDPNGGTTSDGGKTTITMNLTGPDGYHLNNATSDTQTFVGWSFNQENTFTAVWADVIYTVTYDGNGGTATTEDGEPVRELTKQLTKDTNAGASYTVPENMFTRPGYTFAGWNAEYTGDGYSEGDGVDPQWAPGNQKTITQDFTLHAIWRATEYTFTFDANGGKISEKDSEVKTKAYDGSFGSFKQYMTWNGHTFLGWAFSENAETARYDAAAETSVQEIVSAATEEKLLQDNAITLYAVWDVDQLTVSYSDNGGEDRDATATVDYGTTITIDPNGGEYDDDNSFTSGGSKTDAFDITVGANIPLANPARDGYTFTGWKYADNAFTAQWEENSYTFTFDANGGKISGKDSEVKTRVYTGSFGSFETYMTRDGYTFQGWAFGKDAETARYDATDKMSVQDIVSVATENGLLKDNAVTLYAVWKEKTYTFHLDANGGTVYGMDVLTKDKEYTDTLGPIPSNQMVYDNGHTFLGWAASEDAGAEDVIYGPTEKMQCSELASEGYFTLYAVWDVKQLTVSYSDNGGEDRDATATVDYGTEITIDPNGGVYDDNGSYKDRTDAFTYTVEANIPLANPTRDGYTFTGWVYNANNHRFAARWEEIQYTVTLNANGGTIYGGKDLTRERSYAESIGPIPANEMQRDGYTFQGWAFEQSASEAFYGPAVKMTYADIFSHLTDKTRTSVTLYAVWTPNTYTLTYDANGGAFTSGQNGSYRLEIPASYDGVVPVYQDVSKYAGLSRDGYTFLGWALEPGKTDADYRTGDQFTYQWQQDITLYAVWSQNMYTVTFDANGGTFAEGANTAIPVPENGVIGNGNAPKVSREGYNFAGWYGEDKTTPWSLNEGVVQSDITLYAGWIIKEYSFNYPAYQEGNAYYPTTQPFNYGTEVVVDPNGGTYYGQSEIYKFVIDGSPDKLSLDATATKEGYTFVGWKYEVKDGANTFTAMWAQNQITITFHGNGGTNVDNGGKDLATQTMAQGVYAQLAGNPFTCTGYTFAGWNTKADGTGTTYGDQVSVNFTTNVDLYAMWTANQYTITYNQHREGQDALVAATGLLSHGTQITLDLAGGTLEDWGVLFELDQNLTLPDPWKSGCTFDGWLFNGESNTFTAQWKDITYTVTFDANGGEGTMTTQTFQAGVPEALNENTFTRTNYHFVGWSENADAAQADIQDGQTFTFADQDRSRTLYAIWALDTYDFTYYKHNADGQGNELNEVFTVTHGQKFFIDPAGGTYYENDQKYSTTVTADENTRLLDNTATRPGYTFDGWYYDANTVTFVAQWTAAQYTVTFKDSISGEVYATQTVTGGMGFDPLGIASPDGKQFLGWYLEGAAEPYDCANTPVTGDITLYAVWEDVEYTVTFIGNGGSNEYRDQNYTVTVPYNKALDLTQVPAFTRQGYVFLGWSTQRNHAVDYAASVTTLQVNGDMTLYAVWAQVVDFGTIPYGTGEQHVKTIDYQNGIVNVTNQGNFNAVRDVNDSSRLMISPAKDMAPSNEVYSTIMRVDFDKNNMTQYVQAMVKISQQEMEISTNMFEVAYYTVGDSFTVYVTAAPGQNLTLDVGNAAGALKCTQELQEVAGTPGTYTAVYEVVSIPSDAQNLQFTVTDAFGNTAAYQETINLRTEVIVTVKDGDGSEVASNVYLRDDSDSSKSIALTYENGQYTCLADKATGWDYILIESSDDRGAVTIRNTTIAGESISAGIRDTDGEVRVDYTYGGYQVIAQLVVNGTPVPQESKTISGKYGAKIGFQDLRSWAYTRMADLYPEAAKEHYNIFFTELDGSEVAFDTYGQDNVTWENNTVYLNANITAAYVVYFNHQDGEPVNDDYQVIGHNGTVTQPADPTRTGHLFQGWYTDPECTQPYDFTTPVTKSMTLYAKWDVNTYTVTFDNGYGGLYDEYTQYVQYGRKVNNPGAPERPGYTFEGWYVDQTFQTQWDFNDTVTQTMTLYARWAQDPYYLFYHLGEGAEIVNKNAFETCEIHYGDVIQEPEDPIWEGYTFQGWYLDEACTEPATFPITVGESNVNLYAKWAKDCMVHFFEFYDENGAGTPTLSVTVPYGTPVTQPEDPEANGYIFDGWYKDAACTQKWDFNTPVTQTMHLYAKWVKAVTVTFNLNGGTSADSADGSNFTVQVPVGSTLTAPATPSKAPYTFVGWYADAEKWTNAWNFETGVVSDDITLTAGWAHVDINGNFFDTTRTSTYVRLQIVAEDGSARPATGINDLRLSAYYYDSNGKLEDVFGAVLMQEIKPGDAAWQSGWDTNYAYYTATYPELPAGISGMFDLHAEGYDFVVTA